MANRTNKTKRRAQARSSKWTTNTQHNSSSWWTQMLIRKLGRACWCMLTARSAMPSKESTTTRKASTTWSHSLTKKRKWSSYLSTDPSLTWLSSCTRSTSTKSTSHSRLVISMMCQQWHSWTVCSRTVATFRRVALAINHCNNRTSTKLSSEKSSISTPCVSFSKMM